MKDRLQPIIWDADKLRRLADAITACQRGDTPDVQFFDGKESRFKVVGNMHEWGYVEAIHVYNEAKAALDVPEHQYPPNREGEEP